MIRISADSVVDISKEIIEKYNISILPLHINLGDKTFTDGVDIKDTDLFEYADRTGELAKTAACGIGEYSDYFEKLTENGDEVIHFCISPEMSSSFNNARLAAEDFDLVTVIDSKNLSTGIALLMLRACDLAKKGLTVSEIVNDLNECIPCVDTSFVLDTLEYMHKGGRCSAVAKFGANLLSLKPCIEVKNGVMGVGKKYKGKITSVIPSYIKERLANTDDLVTDRVFVTHSHTDSDMAQKAFDQVKEMNLFDEVLFTNAGCTVSTHCGPNCLGVLFIRKSPIVK